MLTIAIQAGGESRRMGQDKALLPFLGRPLIERVIQRLHPLADEILVTTNRLEAYHFLDLPLHPDLIPRNYLLDFKVLHCAAGSPTDKLTNQLIL